VNGSDVVRRTQQLLKQAGYNPGKVDGFYGPKMAAAANKFFADNKIMSGNFGADEMRVLEQMANRRVQPRA
jgi:peptidoglycan hydrolase-like protein with peptidoglycan-binding domain